MTSNRMGAIVVLFAPLVACSQPSASNQAASDSAESAAPAEVRPPAPRQPSAPGPGCADGLAVELDRSETAMVDWKTFSAARLEAFRLRAESGFRRAAADACRKQPGVAAALKPIRRILVQSGSGAADPTFYGAREGKGDRLYFQYAFVESGLEVPKRADIEFGLRCWADPDRKECADLGD